MSFLLCGIEVPVLCSHLQEEHCFDLNNAVCPLCAANLGRDANAHFIVQHSSSVKRRRKPEKSNSLSGNSAMFGKKLVTSARGNRHDQQLILFCTPLSAIAPFKTPTVFIKMNLQQCLNHF
ncbi:protein DEHYDRATION-INDUCED 19 homolog 5-like [Neltuma alba]|uniref:protein DEHYDRATION-INDUCED 19 homolog 5-like n=1 Tax=Neltuma alba TaxID=207710 RepID=UPI0010A4C850|nr:protein DEHYDRATION-INDUCED 19 homolog 5-like [Prosopis alba]